MSPPIRVATYDNKYLSTDLEQKLEVSERSAYRLLHEGGDGVPGLYVDVYAGYAHINVLSGFWREYIPDLADSILCIPGMKGVYYKEKLRSDQASRDLMTKVSMKGESQETPNSDQVDVEEDEEGSNDNYENVWIAGDNLEDRHVEVIENGTKYKIYFNRDRSTTGLFLDHRRNRKVCSELIGGFTKRPIRVLSLFSHTSSFSVQMALKNPNVHTTNVDSSENLILWAKENFMLNDVRVPRHSFLVEDVFKFLKMKPKEYDMVILDPPPLSRKTEIGFFSSRDHYAKLVQMVEPWVSKGGHLVCFSTIRNFPRRLWLDNVINFGLQKQLSKWKNVHRLKQDVDFRKREHDSLSTYLKGAVFQRME